MNLLQENIIMKGIGQSLIQMSKPTIKEANKMLNEWELAIYKEKNEGATIEVQDKYGKTYSIPLSKLDTSAFILYNRGKMMNETSQLILQICNYLGITLEDIDLIILNN